jgi:integrase
VKLTVAQIKAAKPKATSYRLADGAGLVLTIHPRGGKYWQFRYRVAGREKTESLGVFPEVSLAEARERVPELRKALRSGLDPSELRKQRLKQQAIRARDTFERVALEWFEVWKKGKSSRTVAYKLRRMESDLFKYLGPRPIAEITRREVIDTIKAITSRDVGETAVRALQVIKAIMSYAASHEYRDGNPISDLRPTEIIGSRESKHYARIDTSRLPDLLTQIDAYEGAITRLAMRFMCLTFVRTGTLRSATWAEIDFENRRWNIPPEHMKKVKGVSRGLIVPLSRQSVDVLTQLKTLSGADKHLFPGGSRATMSENTILKALERMGFKGEMTGHGFRGLASTILHEHGFEHLHIERQLAHEDRDESSAPYNKAEFLKQREVMMQWWADYLDQARAKRAVRKGGAQ